MRCPPILRRKQFSAFHLMTLEIDNIPVSYCHRHSRLMIFRWISGRLVVQHNAVYMSAAYFMSSTLADSYSVSVG